MFDNKILTIIIIIIVLLLVYFLFFRNNPGSAYEPFCNDNTRVNNYCASRYYQSSPELNKFYDNNSDGIQNLKIDTMTCHPSCCGFPTATYDGLTSDEIKNTIAANMYQEPLSSHPYVRTSYTCANGENGVGCPCVTPRAYLNLANRSQNVGSAIDIEPTFLLNKEETHHELTPEQLRQSKLSTYSATRRMNDLQVQKKQYNVDHVKAYEDH